ncbi:phosphopantetheine-binding protein [Streptomyces avidinii]|uniref:phosphopantetheine-binding protein n=1 Tax=Streptomyces avidinii TaxID=1895 RepID=UPI0038632995|nr:phosphopantetheine-binding protein [Streptomyces avidinii]
MGLDSLDVFLRTVRDDLGLDIAVPEGADTRLVDLPGWDSLNLLRLVALLEESGHRVPVHRLLEAHTLRDIHTLVKEYA